MRDIDSQGSEACYNIAYQQDNYDFKAAYTLAASLMEQGILSGLEVIIVLLVGNIVTSLGTLRIYIPHYVGIFGPRLGMKAMLISQVLRLFVMIGITGIILMVF
jgi:hypothetical protein